MPILLRQSKRSHVGVFSLLVVLTLLLSTAAVQAGPPPPAGPYNAPPRPGVQAQQSSSVPQAPAAVQTTVGITDPSAITGAFVDDFSWAPEWFPAAGLLDGWLVGNGEIRVVGSSWLTWNPNVPGKHVFFAHDGVIEIHFTLPQQAAGVMAEPNAMALNNITVEAMDDGGHSLGSFTRMIDGNAGAAFLGLASDAVNIRTMKITSEPGAQGFAFTDITYRKVSVPAGWVFFDKNRDGWRNEDETHSGLADAQVRVTKGGETVQTVRTWAPAGYYGLTWEPERPYCITLDLSIQYSATTPTTSCSAAGWDWAPSFGVLPNRGVIDGRVFRDWNGDGVWSAGEFGIGDVAVELWLQGDASGKPALTTTSAADGRYAFDMLPAGTFSVKVAVTDGPLSGLANAGPNPHVGIVLADGGHVSDVDFGYRAACRDGRSTVSGRVWRDANGDAAEDASEAGLTEVRVCAEPIGWAGVGYCARTNSQGYFQLCVDDAEQMITVDRLSGMTSTTPGFRIVDTPGAPYTHFGYR